MSNEAVKTRPQEDNGGLLGEHTLPQIVTPAVAVVLRQTMYVQVLLARGVATNHQSAPGLTTPWKPEACLFARLRTKTGATMQRWQTRQEVGRLVSIEGGRTVSGRCARARCSGVFTSHTHKDMTQQCGNCWGGLFSSIVSAARDTFVDTHCRRGSSNARKDPTSRYYFWFSNHATVDDIHRWSVKNT